MSPASPACGRRTKVSKIPHGISVKSATGVSGPTETPFSTPVVQVGNVSEHVINPVIGQARTCCIELRL